MIIDATTGSGNKKTTTERIPGSTCTPIVATTVPGSLHNGPRKHASLFSFVYAFCFLIPAYDVEALSGTSAAQSSRRLLRCPHVVVPPRPHVKANEKWVDQAVKHLACDGVVALVQADVSNDEGVIGHTICDDASEAVSSRLTELQRKIRSRGIDPTGKESPYRFMEVVSRDEGGRRFDVPVPWLGRKDNGVDNNNYDLGTPLNVMQEEAVTKLHRRVHGIVGPIASNLWNIDEADLDVAAAGFLVNQPGSKSQKFHRDGPDPGMLDVFVPLIDLQECLGPTAVKPGTHVDDDAQQSEEIEAVTPLLRKGELLVFDYRTLHKGQGNQCKEQMTRTLAYVVYADGDNVNGGDVRNFPAATTLEYD